MFERDGKRHLKRLADLDVKHWNALCVGLADHPVQRCKAIAGWLVYRAATDQAMGN